MACGKWNPWQNSQSGDDSNTHPDPLSPPTVLEKGTGPWASLPTPPSAVELTCPWAPARHLLLLLQIPSSLLKYSSSFPSLCYMSFEILVRTFFVEITNIGSESVDTLPQTGEIKEGISCPMKIMNFLCNNNNILK